MNYTIIRHKIMQSKETMIPTNTLQEIIKRSKHYKNY